MIIRPTTDILLGLFLAVRISGTPAALGTALYQQPEVVAMTSSPAVGHQPGS